MKHFLKFDVLGKAGMCYYNEYCNQQISDGGRYVRTPVVSRRQDGSHHVLDGSHRVLNGSHRVLDGRHEKC